MSFYPTPIEEIRALEYPQLEGKTYLDNGGTQLPPNSLMEAFAADINAHVYGNPHSDSAPSVIAGRTVDEVRERTLRFFGANPAEYDLIFTANATAAIKLVMECFRDHASRTSQVQGRSKLSKLFHKMHGQSFHYIYHRDCHNSLVGIREISTSHECFRDDGEVEAWLSGRVRSKLPLTLFAYPGQSNMTGRRLPLSWPSKIQDSPRGRNTFTLLDAAALAMTKRMDISAIKPDFTVLSFYKIFGFPDLGALIVRKSSTAPIFNSRKYFGGGTVDIVISIDDSWHFKKDDSIHDFIEDGTLPFHSIVALGHALDSVDRIYGGMDAIGKHTASLARYLHFRLCDLRHANGKPLIRIYNDESAEYGDAETQGGTVAFNVTKSNGSIVGYADVEKAADEQDIYVRSGAMCNPGGVASYLQWEPDEIREAYRQGHRCSKPIQDVMGRSTGVVRASLGACSSGKDVDRLIDFLRTTYLDSTGIPGTNGSLNTLTENSESSVTLGQDDAVVAAAAAAPTPERSIANVTQMKNIPTEEFTEEGVVVTVSELHNVDGGD